jgi:hypothetical protein
VIFVKQQKLGAKMKSKFGKIFGVFATLALLMGLMVAASPVTAAPGENAWDEIDLPPVDDWDGTDIGVMAIAPDGTMFASVWYDGEWDIVTSTDGFTWEDTTLTGLPDGNVLDWGDGGETPVDIVVSPNWPDDNTVYVGILNGEVYRLGNAGEADPVKLIPIVDSDGMDLTFNGGYLYDLDIFWDGSNNWVAAATDLDVFIIRDALFESWRDFEMATETDSEDWGWAVQVDFAPDFASSGVLWAIASFPYGSQLIMSSTVSPGQWGNNIDEVGFVNLDGDDVDWTPFVDVAFPDEYDSEAAMLWVSIADYDYMDREGNLWMVYGELVPGESEATPIFEHPDGEGPGDYDLGTVEVSGYNILVKEFYTGIVWRSVDGGGTFEEAERSPADGGMYWGHLYMAPGDFDAETGVAYSTGVGPNSALSRTTNGGDTWSQIAYIDTCIDQLQDMAFSPVTSSQPAYLITDEDGGPESLWYTADATAEDVQWVRIGTDDSLGFNHMQQIEFIGDSTDIAMFVVHDGNFEIWKSMNDGDTWSHWRNVPAQVGWIMDFLMTDGTSIYAAGTDAFWGTQAFGPSNIVEFDRALHSVAVYDGMVAVGDGGGNAFLSDDNGETWSDPLAVGDGDDDNVYVAFGPDGTLYAAPNIENGAIAVVQMYDAEEEEFVDVEADSDDGIASTPDGFVGIWASPDNALYALANGSDGMGGTSGTPDEYWVDDAFHGATIQVQAAFSGGTATMFMNTNIDNEIMVLSGTFVDEEHLMIIGHSLIYLPGFAHGALVVEGAESGATGVVLIGVVTGISAGTVLPGEALIPIGSMIFVDVVEGTSGTPDTPAADICLWRLLIGEDDSVWETACMDEGTIVENLWGTTGSNILWTFTDPDDDEDNLGVWALEDFLSGPVTLVAPADGSRIASATSADLEWEEMDTADEYEFGGDFEDEDATDETELEVTGLTDNTEYEWKVRVVSPWTSRWSSMWTFITKDLVDTPMFLAPAVGSQDAPLMPSFVWTEVSGATDYTFELTTDPAFATGVTSVTVTTYMYTWVGDDLLEDQNYYARVRAFNSSTGGVSDWAVTNFHTRVAPTPPVEVTETTTNITLTQQPAETPDTPAYIWIIIIIGAILTIAVIVLIVRTRRVV